MVLCTQCGAILNDLDADKHICKPEDIPKVGIEKKPTTVSVVLNEK